MCKSLFLTIFLVFMYYPYSNTTVSNSTVLYSVTYCSYQ